jgi:rubrerythrin
MSQAAIKLCTCENEGQDRLHGRYRRVHNYAESKDAWRCTVCGNEKSGKREDRGKK